MAQAGNRVAELFAGVGGFRLGLEAAGWDVVWSNQWEPSTKTQHASDCYVARFGADGHVCDDIATVMDRAESGELEIPDVDLLCGGWPCQDYSVAKTLKQAEGIRGKKGVLWWEIVRFLRLKEPRVAFLENVDRLLKSPADQRGRDFAVMVACLNDLGYLVEWRVVNAGEYGFPQRRRRVFVVARRAEVPGFDGPRWIHADGVMPQAFPVVPGDLEAEAFAIDGDLPEVSERFGRGERHTPFGTAGVALDRKVWTASPDPFHEGASVVLGDVLQPTREVPASFFIPGADLEDWRYLKGAKRIPRTHASGGTYHYSEGAVAFPDPLDRPSRTILTGEGGRTPSRFKHVVKVGRRHRRLTPVELERLNGFPDGWTDTGMPDGRRAFMMGNAVVVGVIERIGRVLREQA